MKLKIGENIRRLRQNKGMTQEQLAELMNVSGAAVSKWESSNTYPDITTLIPLARVFDVSIDELMGYASAREEPEIEEIISKHRQLHFSEGNNKAATELITKARTAYPNDYRIMNCYMWDIAGGKLNNNPEILNAHHDELIRICDCILNGCTDEPLRLDAIVMKAKLIHASGNTEEALEILSQLPSWNQSSELKTEQLFEKDTAQYRYWIQRNLYALADLTANKLVRSIWYEDGASLEERISRCEAIGDLFTTLHRQCGETIFAIFEHMVFAELSGKLTFACGNMEDILRLQQKKLIAAGKVTEAAKTDSVLREGLFISYKTDNLLQWTLHWLKTSAQPPLARLREHAEYMAMLDKFEH